MEGRQSQGEKEKYLYVIIHCSLISYCSWENVLPKIFSLTGISPTNTLFLRLIVVEANVDKDIYVQLLR